MSFVINPLHPLFAAEMLGADLHEPPHAKRRSSYFALVTGVRIRQACVG